MRGLGEKAKGIADLAYKSFAARSIQNAIREWRGNKISTSWKRWLFELIQNAVDTAKARGKERLKIEIKTDDNNFIFRHNGGYFTLDEINAILYGGSTKPYSPESEYIGRFGTGFLVTHIVSRIVEIKGLAEDEDKIYKFEFKMDRNGGEDNIIKSIDDAYAQLNDSKPVSSTGDESLPPPESEYTEFIYHIDVNDEIGKTAVEIGIKELKANLPFLFAFNHSIEEICIDGEKFINKIEKIDSENNIQFIRVNSIIVIKKLTNDIEIAIAIENNKIVDLTDRPRIYIGMPLTETAHYINIPFVINSSKLVPVKERDALDSQEEVNKIFLETAFKLYKELLNSISSEDIKGIYKTVDFGLISNEKTSQNPLWDHFNNMIKNTLVQIIGEIPLVDTYDGKKRISETIFPSYKYINEAAAKELHREDELRIRKKLFDKFYNLVKQIRKNIPKEDEVDEWIKIAEKLKIIKAPTLYDIESMKNDLSQVCAKLDIPIDIELLEHEFNINNAKEFLLSFYDFIDELYQMGVIQSTFIENLLPDQQGRIKKGFIWIDDNIPEDLKDILHKIGFEIRKKLLDKDFSKFKIVNDFLRDKMNMDKALDIVIQEKDLKPSKIKKVAKDPFGDEWDEKNTGWVELFKWCLKKGNLKSSFPIIVKSGEIDELNLEDSQGNFIIPFKYIGIDEEYEVIYPEGRVLHSKYFEDDSENLLPYFENYKVFISRIPLYKNTIKFEADKLKSIAKTEISESEHEIKSNEQDISFLPLWNEVIGRISKNPERAKIFFKFVSAYITKRDESWKKEIEVTCSCKNEFHKIIPSFWLASLKSDSWIPFKTVDNKEEKIISREASKESIENLFTKSELDNLIKENYPEIIDLLSHLGFDKLDLHVKLKSIETGKDEGMIREEFYNRIKAMDKIDEQSLKYIAEQPEIISKVVEKIREEAKFQEIKNENQKVGKTLERIIAKILVDRGFTVKPIYKGADLELWPDRNTGWDAGQIEIEPYLLEVKFTSTGRIHLSKTQSEIALQKENRYFILVVNDDSGFHLREKLKQINEDSIPDVVIDEVIKSSKVIDEIHTKLLRTPNIDEIEPDIHGYWIKSKLWENKSNIIGWIEQLFKNKPFP